MFCVYWLGLRPRPRSGFSAFALNMFKFWAVFQLSTGYAFIVYNFSFRPAPPDGVVCFSIQRANSFFSVCSSFFGPPRGFLVGSIIKHPSGFTFSPCFPPAASLNQLYLKNAILSSVFCGFGGLFPYPNALKTSRRHFPIVSNGPPFNFPQVQYHLPPDILKTAPLGHFLQTFGPLAAHSL